MGFRTFWAQVLSGQARDSKFNLPDEVMFPDPGHAIERSFLDVSARTGSMVDMSTPAGVGLGTMGLDPLEESFCANLNGANRRDEDQ